MSTTVKTDHCSRVWMTPAFPNSSISWKNMVAVFYFRVHYYVLISKYVYILTVHMCTIYTTQKNEKNTLKTHQISLWGEKNHARYLYWCVCWELKDTTSFDGNENY